MAKDWDIIITNKSKLFSLDLHEVWRYRDLLAMYVKRDIITFYKQTILGPLWFIIQPLFTTIMFMFVFGGIAGISTDGIPLDVCNTCHLSLIGDERYLSEIHLGVGRQSTNCNT